MVSLVELKVEWAARCINKNLHSLLTYNRKDPVECDMHAVVFIYRKFLKLNVLEIFTDNFCLSKTKIYDKTLVRNLLYKINIAKNLKKGAEKLEKI